MRNIGVLGLVFLIAAPAVARAAIVTCDQYATVVADEATKDSMLRAGERETSGAGKVLVIAAGNKFFIPAKQADDRSLAPASVWQRMRDWNSAYGDAFWRCRHSNDLTLPLQK